MMSRYVQHKSGVGEKWALASNDWYHNEDLAQKSWAARRDGTVYYLPKSEYIECEPPERWERVKVSVCPDGNLYFGQEEIEVPEGYRFVLDGEVIYLERQVKG